MRILGAFCLTALVAFMPAADSTAGVRARELGVPFEGTPGTNNAITDVRGIEVGQTTVIRGAGKLERGKGPVRTGVTIIHPLGKSGHDAVAAGFAPINGTGEFTGTHMINETGMLFGPIGLTATGNLSLVHRSLIDWAAQPGRLADEELFTRLLPVVGETLDIRLNDVFGHPLTQTDVFAALDNARSGAVAEGNVGGGTGMVAFGFKGGIGTASRVISVKGQSYTVGVILQANNGRRHELRIAGVPVGQEITDLMPTRDVWLARPPEEPLKHSLLLVLATDVPLQAHQLQRMARHAALGVGRSGGTASNFSGEFALAFSTTNTFPYQGSPRPAPLISDNDHELMDKLFEATVQSVEEAIVNQLVASETMTGVNDVTVHGLPHDRLVALLKKYDRHRPFEKRPPEKH